MDKARLQHLAGIKHSLFESHVGRMTFIIWDEEKAQAFADKMGPWLVGKNGSRLVCKFTLTEEQIRELICRVNMNTEIRIHPDDVEFEHASKPGVRHKIEGTHMCGIDV